MFLHCSSHLFTLRTVQCPRCLFSCPFIPFRIDVSTSFCLEECIFHPFSVEESSRTCLQWRKESEEKTIPAPWRGSPRPSSTKKKGGELGCISLAILFPQPPVFPFPPTPFSFSPLSRVPSAPFFIPAFLLLIASVVTLVLKML